MSKTQGTVHRDGRTGGLVKEDTTRHAKDI